jgi:trimethylamine:corrinoid methyltransferase-like protein
VPTIWHRNTLQWFQQETYIPSAIIDRGSLDAWRGQGSPSTFERARSRVDELLQTVQPPELPDGLPAELRRIATAAAHRFGMDELPELLQAAPA